MIWPVFAALQNAIQTLPAGAWGVGVSGGADSTALLRLLASRSELRLAAMHLNHETRGDESDADEGFVLGLAQSLQINCYSAKFSQIDLTDPPANPSARYRAARLAWFGQIIARENLRGVVLAHHANDQTETILQRLLRGSGFHGLAGMQPVTRIGSLLIHRPLLSIQRQTLREYLRSIQQAWREDSSNLSDRYGRNVIREVLSRHPALHPALLGMGHAMSVLRRWTEQASPLLENTFAAASLVRLPGILSRESARRWLVDAGCPAELLGPAAIEQLILMAGDAATPPKQYFPGGIVARRKSGWIQCEGA